jgi:uracil-DNA glycosylase
VKSRFVTDCLTTYRLSVGAANRISDTYQPFAQATPRLEPADLAPHPGESHIVQEALSTQTGRLTNQLSSAQPKILVTLGNAASRIVTALAGLTGSGKLTTDAYATPQEVKIGGTSCTWIAAVHPATPAVWQSRHAAWLANGGFGNVLR